MFCPLYQASSHLTAPPLLYLYNNKIRPKMENCYYIFVGVAQSIEKCLRRLVVDELFSTLQHLSHRQNIASHSYSIYDKLHSLLLKVQTFTVKTHHAMYTGTNYSNFFRIRKIEVPFAQFLPRNRCFVKQTLKIMLRHLFRS